MNPHLILQHANHSPSISSQLKAISTYLWLTSACQQNACQNAFFKAQSLTTAVTSSSLLQLLRGPGKLCIFVCVCECVCVCMYVSSARFFSVAIGRCTPLCVCVCVCVRVCVSQILTMCACGCVCMFVWLSNP